MRGARAHAHDNRELAGARWVRRAAADSCALRRSAPTWASAPSLFSERTSLSAKSPGFAIAKCAIRHVVSPGRCRRDRAPILLSPSVARCPQSPAPGAHFEVVNQFSAWNVPAFRASTYRSCLTTRSRACLFSAGASRLCSSPAPREWARFAGGADPRCRCREIGPGASRLVSLPIRSKHKAASIFQTSLEEAAVHRPGREAGKQACSISRAPKARHMNHPDRLQGRDCYCAFFARPPLWRNATRAPPPATGVS